MKYRVQVDVAFDLEKDALSFIEKVKEDLPKFAEAVTSTKGINLDMPKSIKYHQCRHDENPPAQCGAYIEVDLTK